MEINIIESKGWVYKTAEELTNDDLKKAKKFYEVFDEFWNWCCKQKTTKNEKIIFFVYGNFDDIKKVFIKDVEKQIKELEKTEKVEN